MAENYYNCDIEEFVTAVPPHKNARIVGLFMLDSFHIDLPVVFLYCYSDTCTSHCMFGGYLDHGSKLYGGSKRNDWMVYTCRNCKKFMYNFAVMLQRDPEDGTSMLAVKVGQSPPFGPPVPSRLNKLLGPDRGLFFKGRRAEGQGLGLGAAAYYRRVVENQWSRIVDEIKRVATETGATQESINVIDAARDETRFSESVKKLNDAVPASLLVNGKNPLTLLHGTLSHDIHAGDDGSALDVAQSIRTVLTALAENIAHALSDKQEVEKAVKVIEQKRQSARTGGQGTKNQNSSGGGSEGG